MMSFSCARRVTIKTTGHQMQANSSASAFPSHATIECGLLLAAWPPVLSLVWRASHRRRAANPIWGRQNTPPPTPTPSSRCSILGAQFCLVVPLNDNLDYYCYYHY